VSEPAPAPSVLPPPLIDPADVQAIIEGLSPQDAELYASLATLALEAVAWPNALPAAPLPAPLYTVGLGMAVRLAMADQAISPDGTGAVVSESIGGYTYRLSAPGALDVAFQLSDAERKLIRPWLGQSAAYDVSVGWGPLAWPADWWQNPWQRDLDRIPTEEPAE
jgi:hypothetical protein